MSSPSPKAVPIETVASYLTALRRNCPDEILAFFAPNAEVISPTYGRMQAEPFYRKLCADTESVEIVVRGIYSAAGTEDVVAAHFDYDWVLADGTVKSLELLDLFTFQDGRIGQLRIFADARR